MGSCRPRQYSLRMTKVVGIASLAPMLSRDRHMWRRPPLFNHIPLSSHSNSMTQSLIPQTNKNHVTTCLLCQMLSGNSLSCILHGPPSYRYQSRPPMILLDAQLACKVTSSRLPMSSDLSVAVSAGAENEVEVMVPWSETFEGKCGRVATDGQRSLPCNHTKKVWTYRWTMSRASRYLDAQASRWGRLQQRAQWGYRTGSTVSSSSNPKQLC